MIQKKKTRIVILGAGISGLALGWYLAKDPENELRILEKEKSAGGLLGVREEKGFFFEKSARIFKKSSSKDLLALLEECNLAGEIIHADERARGRYLLHEKRLHRLPTNLVAFFRSQVTRPLMGEIMGEWRKPYVDEEESIWEFAVRRFGPGVAERLFDPLVVGIYAGDIRRLSMRACLPEMKRWEKEYGSLTRGFFAERRESGTLFSLRGGTSALVQKLQEGQRILFEREVKGLHFSEHEVRIVTDSETFIADHVFSALPCGELKKLLPAIPDFRTRALATVNFGFASRVLDLPGFGYLAPSSAGENIFGVVFDSNLFPQQSGGIEETRLTVMLPDGADLEAHARRALQDHLGIRKEPDYCFVEEGMALPQFEIGHQTRVQELLERIPPRLHVVGNYLEGASVSDVIRVARRVSASVTFSSVVKAERRT